jgi:hypothetical protein
MLRPLPVDCWDWTRIDQRNKRLNSFKGDKVKEIHRINLYRFADSVEQVLVIPSTSDAMRD